MCPSHAFALRRDLQKQVRCAVYGVQCAVLGFAHRLLARVELVRHGLLEAVGCRARHLLRHATAKLEAAAAIVDAHTVHLHVGLLAHHSVPNGLGVLLLRRVILALALRRLVHHPGGRLRSFEARVCPRDSTSVVL